MKAGIVIVADRPPAYGDFREPIGSEGLEIINVGASALSQFSKSRSLGSHYSSQDMLPSVAGSDGVGRAADGRRVYFVLPEAPFGALAEKSLVRSKHCVAVPDSLDDVSAAAIANPGMSAWAALVERARLKPGETVLINGATGTAGRLAVQLAKFLGAGRVIGTGRNNTEVQELLPLGADVIVPFMLDTGDPAGARRFEESLVAEFVHGIDVVIDYLWGGTARSIVIAIAQAVGDGRPVRFIHVGGASRQENIELPGAALRSSAVQLMGSGVKSVPFPKLLEAIQNVFEAAAPAKLQITTKTAPLSEIEQAWTAPGKPRVVITIP